MKRYKSSTGVSQLIRVVNNAMKPYKNRHFFAVNNNRGFEKGHDQHNLTSYPTRPVNS